MIANLVTLQLILLKLKCSIYKINDMVPIKV